MPDVPVVLGVPHGETLLPRDIFLKPRETQIAELSKRLPEFAKLPPERQVLFLNALQRTRRRPPREAESYLKEYAPDVGSVLGALALEAVMPESGVATAAPAVRAASRLARPLLRTLGATAGGATGAAVTGQSPTRGAMSGLLFQGSGEALVWAGRFAWNPVARRFLASGQAEALAGYIKSGVPGWAKYPSTAQGLFEMVHGDGLRALSKEYETVLKSIRGKLTPDATLTVTRSELQGLPGLTPTGLGGPMESRLLQGQMQRSATKASFEELPGEILAQVKVSDAIDLLPKLREKGSPLYRPMLDRITTTLEGIEEGLGEEFKGARRAYSWGRGAEEFFTKSNALEITEKGAVLNPQKAQTGLQELYTTVVEPRGMGGVRTILMPGPPGTGIREGRFSLSTLTGPELTRTHARFPLYHLPETPVSRQVGRVLPTAIAETGRVGVRHPETLTTPLTAAGQMASEALSQSQK